MVKKPIINERIRAKEVRLIDEVGAQLGVVSIEDARRSAAEKGLDLLLISDKTDPVVCKLVNYGQFMYQQKKKDKKAKKSNRNHIIKEIKMSPKISQHDFDVRVNRSKDFLAKGYKVKLTVPFRGREVVHPELGQALIDKFLGVIGEAGIQDGEVLKSHRSMILLINAKTT